jgi:uncharacterized protein involved in type VI secretion and phage assembly
MPAQASGVTVPLFSIMIDGTEIDPVEQNSVHEIKITDWLRLPDTCTLAVGYQAEHEGSPFQKLDDSKFEVGAALEVKMGSTDDSVTQTLFKGEIVTVEPDFQAGSVAMVVRAYDKSHRMMRARKQRAFLDKTISDIVTQIGQEYSFSVSTTASGDPLDFVLQHNETDWDFIWRLAKRIGFEFLVTGDSTAEFGPPKLDEGEVELSYPDDLHTFRPRITAVQQVAKVNVRGFDLKTKQDVVAIKDSPTQLTEAGITRAEIVRKFPDTALEISGQSFASRSEAESIAQSMLDQLANAYLGAEGSCAGNPNIKAGVKLKITGVGSDFSGTYRVAKARHLIGTAGGYTTEFSNSVGEHTLLGQAGGGNHGPLAQDSIMVGIVTDNADPEKFGRVKVQLPALSGEQTFWAPVLVPSAGKERGLMMLPVPGEHVVVAFENGDPSYPYVLGSLFNGKDTPGEELAVEDGSFGLRSDHKAVIAAQEDITLRTEKGKWIVEVNAGEITETVKSPGNYTGSFDGKHGITAKQAITLESNQSVSIKAPSISLEAQGTMSLKANGQLTVESQGMLELKGATVMVSGQATVSISGALINLG